MKIIRLLPFLTVLVLIIGTCSIRIGGYPLLPTLFLIPVFYWLVFRPDLLPLWSVFAIGLYYDALMGFEMGLSSFLLMTSALVAHYLRPYLTPHRFFFIWGTFSLYSFCYLTLYGLVTSSGVTLFVSWVYGLLLYPLLSWGLSQIHLRIQKYV